MFEILQTEEIKASRDTVWGVIVDTEHYPAWNPFVVACASSFEVGSPIKMKVKVLPFMAMPQKETIIHNRKGELLEYGIKIPLGLLASSRKHLLTSIDADTTKYESVFVLSGLLAPVVGLLLGSQLRRGFGDMTNGVVSRSLAVQANGDPSVST